MRPSFGEEVQIMQLMGTTSPVAAAAASAVPSNPLAAKRQSITPVHKSRSSLTGTMAGMSASMDTLARFQQSSTISATPAAKAASDAHQLSLRPMCRTSNNTSSAHGSPSQLGARASLPALPRKPMPIARGPTPLSSSSQHQLGSGSGLGQTTHKINLEDSLRKQTLVHNSAAHKSASATDNAPARRYSSMPVGKGSSDSLRSPSIAALDEPDSIKVLRRSVSVVGSANLMSTSPPGRSDSLAGSPSVIEIRSQIPCRNMKANGVCPFGSRCHYKHDFIGAPVSSQPGRSQSVAAVQSPPAHMDDAEVDKKILDIRKEIPCRNFSMGVCTFGNRCFYKHCDGNGKVVEETGVDSLSAMSLLRFPNPYGDGDICAAGVIPYARIPSASTATSEDSSSDSEFAPVTSKKGKKKSKKAAAAKRASMPTPTAAKSDNDGDFEEVWALFQVEDMLNEETGKWSAALAMFGGKVGPKDEDWLATAAREFAEETGFLVGDLNSGIPSKMAQFTADDEDTAFSYTKYLELSKFQCLYYPVADADDLRTMQQLPQRYWEQFKGEVSQDWTRAATRLEPVLLLRSKLNPAAGWKVCDINTREPHSLPLKVPLAMALRAAEFPWPAPETTVNNNNKSNADAQLEDLLGGLDSLLNIRIPTTTKTTSQQQSVRSQRRSSIVNTVASLAALDESPLEAAFGMRGSNEIMCCN